MNDQEAVNLLLKLVSIPSVTGQEGEAVCFVLEALAAHGLETVVDAVGNGIGRTTASPERLMFLGHIDTVPGHVEPRVDAGRVFGRGAVDAKGALAASMVAAMRAKHVAGIEIVAATGEEGGSPGARHLARGVPPTAVIVGEPSGSDSVVLGYKGSMRARMTLSQPESHTAGPTPTVADRAIDAWMRVRGVCRDLSLGQARFDTLTPALLNISTGTDGLERMAEMQAAFRIPPGSSLDIVRSRIEEALSPGAVEFSEADPPYRASRRTPLVASFVRSIRAQEAQPRFKVKTGTSDMNIVGPAWNCPILAYGPGDSRLDHRPNEHLEVHEYLRSIRVLTSVFQEWGNGPCS